MEKQLDIVKKCRRTASRLIRVIPRPAGAPGLDWWVMLDLRDIELADDCETKKQAEAVALKLRAALADRLMAFSAAIL